MDMGAYTVNENATFQVDQWIYACFSREKLALKSMDLSVCYFVENLSNVSLFGIKKYCCYQQVQ